MNTIRKWIRVLAISATVSAGCQQFRGECCTSPANSCGCQPCSTACSSCCQTKPTSCQSCKPVGLETQMILPALVAEANLASNNCGCRSTMVAVRASAAPSKFRSMPLQTPYSVVNHAEEPANAVLTVAGRMLPRFFHSDDYQTLVGVLRHNPRNNSWHLRYLESDRDDQFGGIVSLEGIALRNSRLSDGMHVAVRGTVNYRGELCPTYLLTEIHAIAD